MMEWWDMKRKSVRFDEDDKEKKPENEISEEYDKANA